MQEYRHPDTDEFNRKFMEDTDERLDEMRQHMEAEGNTLTKEVRGIKRKDPCPCGSGKKFKNCCIKEIANGESS
jgi:preprotein translocase subunit SecA